VDAVHPTAPRDWLPRLTAAADHVTAVLRTGDLTAAVPSCPGWDLTDLTHHLGRVHRWATTILQTGESQPDPDENPGPAPAERAALAAWFTEGVAGLLARLSATDPQVPCWTFGPRPRTAAFWFRRQAHETAMHAWDAAASQGSEAHFEFPAGLAPDGIDEVATVFFPRQVRLRRMPPLPRTLALEPAGTPYRYVLAGDGTGRDSASAAPAEATVRGPADVLLLLLWRRVGPDDPRLTVHGDPEAVRAVLSAGLTP